MLYIEQDIIINFKGDSRWLSPFLLINGLACGRWSSEAKLAITKKSYTLNLGASMLTSYSSLQKTTFANNEKLKLANTTKNKKPNPISGLKRKKKLIAFGWYGGKFSHLDWLLPLLPDCLHYCEPFAGSGAVLLNKEPSPVETYNDIDGEVVNFFKALREHKESLIEKIALTPFSREEFSIACELDPELTHVERARRFYVRARQVRTGLAQTASIGRWANCKNTSRAGMSGVVSRWLGGVEQLDWIAERLLRVQIENRPAIDAIRLYDSEETLFYCDPPYIHETRGDTNSYGFEMNDNHHRDLAAVLNSVKGKVAISNYDCQLMEELYPASKWTKIYSPEKTIHSTKDKRQEVLWINYAPINKSKNYSLFTNEQAK